MSEEGRLQKVMIMNILTCRIEKIIKLSISTMIKAEGIRRGLCRKKRNVDEIKLWEGK